MLLAAGARWAIGSDARFAHQGQGPFEGGPAGLELVPELPGGGRQEFLGFHMFLDFTRDRIAYIVCIL